MSFKKRIATHFMLATAIIILFVFGTVYLIVQETVYTNLDNDLSFEANKHTSEIDITGETIHFINKGEWEEHEHKQAQVNPVFLQILNADGVVMDKSPNLKENELSFQAENELGSHFNGHLNEVNVRQVQIPMYYRKELKGYIVAAMSLEASLMVLENLRMTLFILFPIVLLGLFFISSFLAGRSIIPVVQIIETTNRITKYNLNERVPLPSNTDELYDLSDSINSLLSRIESALEREQQFTSDASHELRTPLATLKGTLEVLIRKPRERAEYEDKIKFSLTEIDRMTATLEQLLLLARLDTNSKTTDKSLIPLATIIDEILSRYNKQIAVKKLSINFKNDIEDETLVPQYFSNLILENIIGNAVKYAKNNTKVHISITQLGSKIVCKVQDEGIGIKKEDLNNLFNNFFRSDALNHKSISGNGLGLSIAKKAADAINAEIYVESEFGVGTTFTIQF